MSSLYWRSDSVIGAVMSDKNYGLSESIFIVENKIFINALSVRS